MPLSLYLPLGNTIVEKLTNVYNYIFATGNAALKVLGLGLVIASICYAVKVISDARKQQPWMLQAVFTFVFFALGLYLLIPNVLGSLINGNNDMSNIFDEMVNGSVILLNR